MSRLSQPDRGRLVQTCRALKASFCHPSLWNTVTITLLNRNRYNPNIAESLSFVDPASYLPMVERFGAYFKDLTLIYVGSNLSMSRHCRKVIQCIARCCRYEIMTLYLKASQPYSFHCADVNILAALFTNQHLKVLKSLTLLAGIYFDMRDLILNDKMNGCLERLSLNCLDGTSSWGLVSPDMVIVICQFTQLRALYLLSHMLRDDLFASLCDQGRAPLRELGIQVTYEKVPLTNIKVSSWARLRAYSPCLQVHVTVVDLIPEHRLFSFLIPEMAIASLSFIEDAKCYDIISIADRFSSTLRKFVDLSTSPSGLDGELVYMVKTCSHLIHFECNSALWADTIRELAGLRGIRWQHFLVDLDNVANPPNHVSKRKLTADVALIILK